MRPIPGFHPKETDVRAIHSDGSNTLNVDIECVDSALIRLRFENIVGFRVLDELNLTEFWQDYHEKAGSVWEVQSGGWMDLEGQRSAFCSKGIYPDLREFLVVGDMCVNVMCPSPPIVQELGAFRMPNHT